MPLHLGSATGDIGVMLPRNLPARDVLDFARQAEAVGFDELWVVEDLGFRGGIAQTAAVLAVTTNLKVGIGILPVGARNVAFAAMELATLAQVFPGRVIAGIGHGMPDWMRSVGAWPASPLGLLEEYTAALRALLRGETVTTQGRYVQLDHIALDSSAVPDQVPDVVAGVRGPKSLAVAGRVADGVVLAEPTTPEYVRAALDAGARGRIVAYNIAAIGPDGAAALDAARPGLEWIGEIDARAHVTPSDFGADLVRLRQDCADRAEFVARMPAEWVAKLAVAGTPDQARERLAGLFHAGVDSAVLVPVGDPIAALKSFAAIV